MVVYCQFSDVIIFHGEAIIAKVSMRHRQPTSMMSSGDITILKVRWYSSLSVHAKRSRAIYLTLSKIHEIS